MKNEFIVAVTQLAAEKNLPKEIVLEAVETALASAYKKDKLAASNVVVKIDPDTGATRVFARRTIVAEVEDEGAEISIDEARRTKPDAALENFIDEEVTPEGGTGRIAAQTAKQVVLQRLREAEREVVFDEYSGREGEVLSGELVRLEGRNVIIDVGKAEALLPPTEQVRNEHYRAGQRLKFYVVEVYKAAKGPQVVVSRTHKNLLRRLFEMEVPEIFNGVVELKGIAREGGYRSKIAVWSTQDGVDPIGACVGLRGLRIQNIVNELNGERIDVVLWDPEPSRFVAHALSPAQVVGVKVDRDTNTAQVIVPDRQLSLAIGKEGQNARLAAKLTGWRIDIKSESAYEEFLAEHPEIAAAEAAAEEAAKAAKEAAEAGPSEAEPEKEEAVAATAEAKLTPEQEAVLAADGEEEAPAAEVETAAPEAPPAPARDQDAKAAVRFAEDIFTAPVEEPVEKGPAKAAKGGSDEEQAAKPKKAKRAKRVVVEEEDEDEDVDYSVH